MLLSFGTYVSACISERSLSSTWRGLHLHEKLNQPHGCTSMVAVFSQACLNYDTEGMMEMGQSGRRCLASIAFEGALATLRHSGQLGRHTNSRYSPSRICRNPRLFCRHHSRNKWPLASGISYKSLSDSPDLNDRIQTRRDLGALRSCCVGPPAGHGVTHPQCEVWLTWLVASVSMIETKSTVGCSA